MGGPGSDVRSLSRAGESGGTSGRSHRRPPRGVRTCRRRPPVSSRHMPGPSLKGPLDGVAASVQRPAFLLVFLLALQGAQQADRSGIAGAGVGGRGDPEVRSHRDLMTATMMTVTMTATMMSTRQPRQLAPEWALAGHADEALEV